MFVPPTPIAHQAFVQVVAADSVSPSTTDALIPVVPPSQGEVVSPEEDGVMQAMREGIVGHVRDTGKSGLAIRDAHPKAHGCVKARFRVRDGLPEKLRVGLFAQPHDYEAWIRFSNGSPGPQADQVGDARGMAIKVMGVEGSASTTQDFVMINGPAFFVRSVSDYIAFTTASPLWHFFVPSWNPFKIRWREFRNARAITQATVTDPLDIRYWSETPYLFGTTAFKFSAKPTGASKADDANASPDRLREAMKLHLSEASASFDFMVQLRGDADAMPIEDSAIEWDASDAPFVPVATIDIPKQDFDGAEQRALCENLSFTPWHGLPAHRPLGGINRVRRSIYEAVSRLRHELNKTPRQEPSGF